MPLTLIHNSSLSYCIFTHICFWAVEKRRLLWQYSARITWKAFSLYKFGFYKPGRHIATMNIELHVLALLANLFSGLALLLLHLQSGRCTACRWTYAFMRRIFMQAHSVRVAGWMKNTTKGFCFCFLQISLPYLLRFSSNLVSGRSVTEQLSEDIWHSDTPEY